MRILITGSRRWTDDDLIRTLLERLHRVGLGPYTLVHGGAKGADRTAAEIASGLGWKVEAHPADWLGPCVVSCTPGHRKKHPGQTVSYCPNAGLRRNEEMVALGAGLCLAFIKDRSSGATHCAEAAKKAGITTLVFTANSRDDPPKKPRSWKGL